MDSVSPPARILRALPGTLAEISAATEYPAGVVLRTIEEMRQQGVRVNARMGERDSDGWTSTVYEVVPDDTVEHADPLDTAGPGDRSLSAEGWPNGQGARPLTESAKAGAGSSPALSATEPSGGTE